MQCAKFRCPHRRNFVLSSFVALGILATPCAANTAADSAMMVRSTPDSALPVEASTEACISYVELGTKLSISTVSLIVGFVLHRFESVRDIAKIAVYFGAQSFMNLYMKAVLSKAVVAENPVKLTGIPAPFLVTGLQQIISFTIFVIGVAALWFTPKRYIPKRINGAQQWLAVVIFSLTFALNIGLNNFSMALIPISLNHVLRSCNPLATAFTQQVFSYFFPSSFQMKDNVVAVDWLCMVVGALCACLAVFASHSAKMAKGEEGNGILLGSLVTVLASFAASINFVFAGMLGTSVKLNPLDTTCYMVLPAAMFLLPVVLLFPHDVRGGWDTMTESGRITDWAILNEVIDQNPGTLGLVLLSGAFALGYNVVQYTLVQTLSPTHTAFAGNFNKAATIALSLMLGFEHLPEARWGALLILSVVGNIVAFSAFNYFQERRKKVAALASRESETELAATLSERQGLTSGPAKSSPAPSVSGSEI